MKASTHLLASLIMAAIVAASNNACAYLGGFEDVDGYEPFLNDVATYNAGQYGPNAGGGSYVNIPDNTGLWTKLQGPLFPTQGTAGGVAYATGHQGYDRTNPSTSDKALVITTNADGWTAGTQKYSYDIDSYDLAGFSPAATGGQELSISFWSCSRIFGTDEGGGLGPGTLGNIISFYDSVGNLGFELGYEQPATTTDFAAVNVGTWATSSVSVGTSTYHRWDVTLDLAAQTVSVDIFESSTLTNLVSNAPLINNMIDFSQLQFESTPGVNNAKVWALDDFSMSVNRIPEPSTGLSAGIITGMLALGLVRRPRRYRE